MIQLPVLVLNGVSSSGKSTLARALTEELRGVWLTVGTDLLLAALPARFVHGGATPGPDETDQLMALVDRLLSEAVQLAGRLARADHHIIIDVVCQGGIGEQERWNDAVSPRAVVWIGLTAPGHVLDQREVARGDRASGLSRLHRTMPITDVHHDFVVDTTTAPPARLAVDIAKRFGLPSAGDDPTTDPFRS